MRFLLILVGCLAALYGGYWFVGKGAATTAITRGLERLEDGGYEVSYTDITTQGFPSRFDTTLTGLRLSDPARGLAWEAPFFQLFALSTQPNHVIAVWPETQDLTLGGERLTLTSETLRASLRARAAPSVPLREATLEGRGLSVEAGAGWQIDVAATLLALRAVAGDGIAPNSYEVFAEATDIALPRQLLEALGGAAGPAALAERLRIDGRAAFDQPLDRFAPQSRPGLTALTLRDLSFRWGEVMLTGVGSVTIDGTGRPEGDLTLTVTNWEQLIEMAQAAGVLSEGQARTVAGAAVAMVDGEGRLTAPIRFRDGFTALGPLPIGPAPRLR